MAAEDQPDDDEFVMVQADDTQKANKKKKKPKMNMNSLKKGVANFLKTKKKKGSQQENVVNVPEVLMEPQDAQTSILRVILLVAQAQFHNSNANHNANAHNHAIKILNCLARPN